MADADKQFIEVMIGLREIKLALGDQLCSEENPHGAWPFFGEHGDKPWLINDDHGRTEMFDTLDGAICAAKTWKDRSTEASDG